jgi:hypothetical protein
MQIVIPMPPEKDAAENLLRELLKSDLHLSDKATFVDRMPGPVAATELRPDYIIRDGNINYLVVVNNYATEQSIGRLALLKQLLDDPKRNTRYVLAAKNIPRTISDMAQKIKVMTVQLPLNIQVNTIDDGGRITTENAWKVVTDILSNELTSIKAVSRRAEISYGWAHRITNRLISRGIAEKFNDQVRIANLDKLLNVAALERPMSAMIKETVWTDYPDSQDAATGLTRLLDKSGVRFAFTGFTAASIYTGAAVRHDAVYLYIQEEKDIPALKSGRLKNLHGIKIQVYIPDRNVTDDSRIVADVRVVSEGQALLDMAGFGRSGGDLAREMARRYGSIVGNG